MCTWCTVTALLCHRAGTGSTSFQLFNSQRYGIPLLQDTARSISRSKHVQLSREVKEAVLCNVQREEHKELTAAQSTAPPPFSTLEPPIHHRVQHAVHHTAAHLHFVHSGVFRVKSK